MHGDFSRLTFDREKRFSAVLSLQGRVLIDADTNENTLILQHYLRTLAADLLGAAAFPKAARGFEITAIAGTNNELANLGIGSGRCYVDGLLVENPDTPGATTTFYHQPDAYFMAETDPFPSTSPFFAYLQVWERLVTWVEDPATRDVALGSGGPDASARSKVVWQVRCEALPPNGTPPTTAKAALALWERTMRPKLAAASTGKLSARDKPSEDDELCALAPEAGYRGLENQLYRVEIHHGGVLGGTAQLQPAGTGPPTFKWSRDNGAIVFPIDTLAGKLATVSTLGRDDRSQLDVGDWMEVVDDARVLGGPPAHLHRVEDIDLAERRVTLDAIPADGTGTDPTRHPFLRRWDQQQSTEVKFGDDKAITAVDDVWLPLEDGVEVRFAAGTYRSGDYWLIPARVETGTIEWPKSRDGVPIPLPPRGIEYHYAPLALVNTGTTPIGVVDLRP
jgi:Family of unknown function (DUF6519)